MERFKEISNCIDKPVLVKDHPNERWVISVLKKINISSSYPFECVSKDTNGREKEYYKMCVPYEGNENLVGKRDIEIDKNFYIVVPTETGFGVANTEGCTIEDKTEFIETGNCFLSVGTATACAQQLNMLCLSFIKGFPK